MVNLHMDEKKITRCPNCGKELHLDETGRLGWCSVHQTWYAVVPEDVGLAATKNAELSKEKEGKRLRQEAERQQKIEEERRQDYLRLKRNTWFIVFVIVVLTISAVLIFIRPNIIYKNAQEKLIEGNYLEAIESYQEIGRYKDSTQKAFLCSIFIDLENNNSTDAIEKILQLSAQKSINTDIKDWLLRIVSSWQSIGITPEGVLKLIDILPLINHDNILNSNMLFVSAHVAMLGKDILGYQADDIDGDGKDELLVLNLSSTLDVYEMVKEGNQKALVGDSVASRCMLAFGDRFRDDSGDYKLAVSCYWEAYRLDPGEDQRKRIADVISMLPLGLDRMKERLAVIDLYGGSDEVSLKKSEFEQDVLDSIAHWTELEIPASDVLRIIKLARENKVSFGSLDDADTFRKAAYAACTGKISSSQFVDWNHDGFEELLATTPDGRIQYWTLQDEWSLEADEKTGLDGITFEVYDLDVPLVFAVSAQSDGFCVLAYMDGMLSNLFSERGISNYKPNSGTVTFTRSLPGSIDRTETYEYVMAVSSARPVRTGIEWQKKDYPYPETAVDAVQRWLETQAFGIVEEQKSLETSASPSLGFSLRNSIQIPQDVERIKIEPYAFYDTYALYEVSYVAQNGMNVTVYIMASSKENGRWKVSGFSDSFILTTSLSSIVSASSLETRNKLLALNQTLEAKALGKDVSITYKLLVPVPSQLNIIWQSGQKNGSNVAYTMCLYRDNEETKPIISYDLPFSISKQMSYPILVKPGIYFIQITALTADAVAYSLQVSVKNREEIEVENNDTIENANAISFGKAVSASLLHNSDVDVYSFSLAKPSKVNATVSASEDGNKRSRYEISINDVATGKTLSAVAMQGTVEKAHTPNLYLDKGNYVVSIRKGNYYSPDIYTVTVNCEQISYQERENNEGRASASVIPIDTDVVGSFGIAGDADWFSFTIDRDMIVQPRFTFSPLDTSSNAFSLTLLDGEQALSTLKITGKENQKIIIPAVLKKGTYFIKLENSIHTSEDYTLRVVTETVDAAEDEPNGTLLQSTKLLPGITYTGLLGSEDDVDYYCVSFDATATLELSFKFAEQAFNSNIFVVSIEQNGKNLWIQNIKGTSGGLSQKLGVEAGAYYIKVRPSLWSSVFYSLKIDTE